MTHSKIHSTLSLHNPIVKKKKKKTLSNINLSHEENIIKSKVLFINISNANLEKEDKLQPN